MSHPKVVELRLPTDRKQILPPVLHTIRQHAKCELSILLQGLFDNLDDALFELADRSRSDVDQGLYFDSMRRIRLHRKGMASCFLNDFHEGFESIVQPLTEPDPGEVEEYSLLQNDDLEISVAISGIVSKITSQYSLSIMQLTKRMDTLTANQTITERLNPLGPQLISESFVGSLGELDIDIKIRIILLKLFERFVMERLGPIYERCNHLFKEAGVLPDLKLNQKQKFQRPPAQPGSLHPEHRGPAASDSDSLIEQGIAHALRFDAIQHLLHSATDVPNGTVPSHPCGAAPFMPGTSTAVGTNSAPTGSNAYLPSLSTSDVLNVLSALQNDVQVCDFDVSKIPTLTDLRATLLARTVENGKRKSLVQSDDDTVNVLGMLFDYILNDKNLAIPMKALIGRLQIPIVKIAIIDKTFFEKSSHPARALLNELSSAGIGWSNAHELKRDSLYDKIESVVMRVLKEFSDGPELFESLLRDLRQFLNQDNKRSVLVEQHVKETERSKAKMQEAKLQVQKLVNQKACGVRLPQEAGRFIGHTWSRVLVLRSVKHGNQSSQWTLGITNLDDLLWMLQPLADADDIDSRETMIGNLIHDIQQGMADISCSEEEVNQWSNWLTTHLHTLSDNDRAYLDDEDKPEIEVPMRAVKEVVLALPEPHTDDGDVAFEQDFADKLDALAEGTWVEIKHSKDTLRCKLATITQPGDNYIFVNRRGMKVFETNRLELAGMFSGNTISLIDESQVFDRALQSVIGNLRQMQRNQTTS